jgi:hypothetical protein
MNPTTHDSTPLTNPRHEAFAQARFSGLSVMDAYRAAGYAGHCPKVASSISQHRDVRARLMELHNAAGTIMVYERLDAIKDLVTIIKAPPSAASAQHPLCEVRSSRHGEHHRFPPKLRALARLIRIMGWDEKLRHDSDDEDDAQTVDTLKEWLYRERNRHRSHHPEATDPDTADEWHEPACAGSQDPTDNTGAGLIAPHQPLCGPLSPRQEAFAQARFAGMNVMEAYRAAGYASEAPQRASRVNRHPLVQARIAELRKAAEDMLPYKRHEAVNDLIAIVQACPEEASADNPLCETRMGHQGPYHRFPCKLATLALLSRLMHWHEPPRVKIIVPGLPKVDTLQAFLARTRART